MKTPTNPYTKVCQAVIITIKAIQDKAEIAVHGDDPNNTAVIKLKDVVATAISESIAAYKADKAKQEVTNAD